MNSESAASAFQALGNVHRVAVLRMLVKAGDHGLNVTQLREGLDLPPSTLAHHLKMLKDAGVVRQEKAGREVVSFAEFCRLRELGSFLLEDCCKGF